MEIDVFGDHRNKKEYYPEDYNFFDLYRKKFVVRSVIDKLSRMFASGVFTDESGKETDLLKKIQTPNNSQSTEEWLKDIAINIFTSGYAMIWDKYASYGVFSSLELIVISTDSDITQVGKKSVTTSINGKQETIPIEDITFFYDNQKKQGSLEGCARLMPFKAQLDNITDGLFAKNIQIENSGTTVVSPKATSGGNNVDEGLDALVPQQIDGYKTQKQEMEDRLNSRGISNRIIVSNKGLDAKNLSAELNTMKFDDIIEADILAVYDAYSFPPELTPYGKNATFENKPFAENSVIETEVFPLSGSIVRSLNQKYSAYGHLKISYNHLNSVSTTKNKMNDALKTISDIYTSLFREGLISEKEALEKLKENGVL